MAKSDAQKISRLGDVAAIREREAAQEFAACLTKYNQHMRQIGELKHYRQDYARRLAGDGNPAISAHEAQRLAGFIANIDKLISNMNEQAEILNSAVRESRQAWQIVKSKMKSFEKLAAARAAKSDQQQNQRLASQLEDAWLARNFSRFR